MIAPPCSTTLFLRRAWAVVLVVVGILVAPARVEARPDLKTVRSKFYVLHSDLEDSMILDLGTRMDAMYAEYSRRLSDFEIAEDPKPIDVYLFDSKDDYLDFTHSRYLNTGGV